jgi:rare lipoprotein A
LSIARKPARWSICLLVLASLFLIGCGHKTKTAARVPPPPPPTPVEAPRTTADIPPPTKPIPEIKPPLYTQVGKASWYGAPFHNRKAANGEIYDMHALTAAHLTLPLNTVVRVTNLQSGQSAVVRITDRGPFVEDRIIDLSFAAAKAIDIWRRGVAMVRVEVLESPAAIRTSGRWCVQLGGFPEEGEARRIQNTLSRRYQTAKVLAFSSPVGDWWVRVRVLGDDRRRAQEILEGSPAPKSQTFLVRLD